MVHMFCICIHVVKHKLFDMVQVWSWTKTFGIICQNMQIVFINDICSFSEGMSPLFSFSIYVYIYETIYGLRLSTSNGSDVILIGAVNAIKVMKSPCS